MLATATLMRVNTREFAVDVIYGEFQRQRMTLDQLAKMASVSPNSIRAIGYSPKVQPGTLRRVEGALGMPRRLLDLIIDGDAARITALPVRTDAEPFGIDPDLRRDILDGLEHRVDVPRDRRSTDKRRRRAT